MTVYWNSPYYEVNELGAPRFPIDAETTHDPSHSYGVQYQIVGGADGALFGLFSDGAFGLSAYFPKGADYELPVDANRDNV